MNISVRKVGKLLSYLGLVPFLMAAVVVLIFNIPVSVVAPVFIIYSALILSFMSGALWGMSFIFDERKDCIQLVSVMYPLIAWGLILWGNMLLTLVCLSLSYIHLWWFEKRLFAHAQIGVQYQQMRLLLTTLVVLSHLAVIFYSLL
tara:strand:- start:799 stop:1236 length:438 start_codon:yes stop_codon:yes gene_type:complete